MAIQYGKGIETDSRSSLRLNWQDRLLTSELVYLASKRELEGLGFVLLPQILAVPLKN